MHWKLLPRISVQACNNAEKWTPGAPKTTPDPWKPSKIQLEGSEIDAGALQDVQKPAKCDNKRSKKRKTRLRSTQDRKMVPTWPPGIYENLGF